MNAIGRKRALFGMLCAAIAALTVATSAAQAGSGVVAARSTVPFGARDVLHPVANALPSSRLGVTTDLIRR